METSIIKEILNNVSLLRWVKKFTAQNLLDSNDKAKSFNIVTNASSVSVMDKTATKLFVSNSSFEGKELTRFNLAQLAELIDVAGSKGEVVIPDTKNREMIALVDNNTIVICPLPVKDKAKK